jgi:CheY-like chemotaxis protein
MFDRVRAGLSRWMGSARTRDDAGHPLLFADHTEIRDIAVQMARTKVELDRAVLSLRSWSPEQAAWVLLVDDDSRLLGLLTDMLRAGGHEVTTAGAGEEALSLFDPAQHDVVITDLGMPRVTGWDVAGRVKARSPDTPVFLLTGWGEGVIAGESSRFVDRVIAKPISADVLLGQLAAVPRGRAGTPFG